MKSHIWIIAVFLLSINAHLPVVEAKKDKSPPLGSRGEGILCTDHFPARPARAAAALEKLTAELSYPPYPYEDTFLLHSYPSSSYKLYIDFDGYVDGQYIYTAWDTDGDPSTFSEAERLEIQKMWYLTSEDFMPFTIDVTTEEPGAGFPGMRCVVDGSGMYDYGWAYMGVWPDSEDYCYSGIWDNDWIWIAQAVSHEVGHTLNLLDHGDDTTGYYMGHGEGWTEWGVIMGWDSWSLGVWDDGDYPNPNNPEDSLAIIVGSANPGVDFRPDDHGSTIGTATPIYFTTHSLELTAEGIIEQRTDVDYFEFTTHVSGNVQFSINEDVVMGTSNLDVLAKIHDSSGTVLYESNPLWEIWASFDVTLPAGNYYLSIDGTGQDHPDGDPSEGYGYSDYGILGYYSILAMGAAGPDIDPPSPDPMTFATPPYAASDTSISMTATTATDENPVEYYFKNITIPGHDSGWQGSSSYTDTALTTGQVYGYKIICRDLSANYNMTGFSAPEFSMAGSVGGTVTVPDIAGYDQTTAEKVIIASGMTVGAWDSAHSDVFAIGRISSQDPPGGTTAAQNDPVDFTVSLGLLADHDDDDMVGLSDIAIVASGWLDTTDLTDFAQVSSQWLEIVAASFAYWPLDTDALDDSLNGWHGTLNGDASFTTDPTRGDCLALDGDGDYINVGFILNPADGPFSLCAWVKDGTDYDKIMCQTNGTGTGGIWLNTNANGYLTTTLKVSGGQSLISAYSGHTDGDWHHVAMVYDGNRRYLYADGDLVAGDTGDLPGSLETCDGDLYVGADKTLVAGTFWDGLMDDIRIYNRAMSSGEISALYNSEVLP